MSYQIKSGRGGRRQRRHRATSARRTSCYACARRHGTIHTSGGLACCAPCAVSVLKRGRMIDKAIADLRAGKWVPLRLPSRQDGQILTGESKLKGLRRALVSAGLLP